MIFASIVSRIPGGIQSWWNNPSQVFKVMMPFIAIGVVPRSCLCRRVSVASRSSTHEES